MKTIVFIGCVKKKLSRKAKAEDLYISPFFKYNLAYARSLKSNKIFILSAEYGLVDLSQKITPYDKTLNNMHDKERKKWALRVEKQLMGKVNFNKDKAIFLAGGRYRKYLFPLFKNFEIPMMGMGIGKQLQFLRNKVKNEK